MVSINSSDQESTIDAVTPPTVTKKARAPKGTPSKAAPKAVGEEGGEGISGGFSATEVQLLAEMLCTLGENANGLKFNWAVISEKLDLPSAGATAKRAERLLKRFDLKMSDVTGGRHGRTPKRTNGDATPGSKRKTGGASNALESPTKRRAKPAVKEGAADGGPTESGKETPRLQASAKPKGVSEYDAAEDDVFST